MLSLPPTSSGPSVPRSKQSFTDAYVFIIGGGNYTEYQNLIDWASSANNPVGASGSISSGLAGSAASSVSAVAEGLGFGSSSSTGRTGLTALATGGASRHVVYGCTELLRPTEFLSQVNRTEPVL
ncbi:unnamed protein product [Protopolystoma xenopodis]|uniref:Uncharacterized protein n=1 Tax=Protopolystoma xenopodis TaxID=117903 RepID=A0A3S5AVM3_9PLAT|nr:unnamed protein product [Protopolystoma xenopodis]